MYRDRTVGVVLPVRQAAGFVESLLGDLPAFVDRVVVVDDGSTDGTAAIARRAAGGPGSRFGARVQVLVHPSPQGPGAAVVTGYRALLALGLDLVVALDHAGRLDGADLARLLDPLVDGDIDFVKGTRLRHPFVRHVGRGERVRAAALSALGRWVTGARSLSDAGCLHHALTADALRCLPLNEMWRGDAFFLDLLAKVAAAGLAAEEVPVRPTSRRLVGRRVPHRLLLVAARSALRRLRPARITVLPPSARMSARSSARMAAAREVNPPPQALPRERPAG